jgi:ABC-type Fe3+-hydroxamate transport system substrate-binding protein
MAVGEHTFIQDMLSRFGWQNVCKDFSRYPELTMQEIQMLEPEYVLLSSEPYPFKQKHVKELKIAMPQAQVLFVDGELFSWYGSRLLLAAPYFRLLAETIQKGLIDNN